MRRGLTDIVFGHIEKNSFALYNSCVKSGCFGLKRFNKFLYFLYTEKVAAYIQRSVKFGHGRLKSFHIYNLDIISSKKRDSGPANASFWISE